MVLRINMEEAKMKFKDNVVIDNGKLKATGEILKAMNIADSLSLKIARKELVVTSVLDGKHKLKSKHYEGNAFDMRVWIYTEDQLVRLIAELKDSLPGYDVVYEIDHIHIEYDPK